MGCIFRNTFMLLSFQPAQGGIRHVRKKPYQNRKYIKSETCIKANKTNYQGRISLTENKAAFPARKTLSPSILQYRVPPRRDA